MSAAATVGDAPPRWPSVAGWVLTALAVALTFFVYWGLGPRPKSRAWWEPSASVMKSLSNSSLAPLVDELPVAMAGFGLASLALAAAVFATSRSALARFLAVFGVLATASFVFYAVSQEARFVWSFFHWRWSASVALLAAVGAAALTAPLLAASWLRLAWPLRVAVYLPVLLGVIAFERNVTGTDPGLRFAISPWPVVQIFGFELAAMLLGAIFAGVGIGLYASARARRGAGAALFALGAAAGVMVPIAVLAVCAMYELLPFAATFGFYSLVAVAGGLAFTAAATVGVIGDAEATGRRALVWTVAAALVLGPIALGQLLARMDYASTRDGQAQSIIDGLNAYQAREGAYPEALEELVQAGDLESVPVPAIGFRVFTDQEFVYQNFGDSYLLEFSAPRWTQCAYNPPYVDEDGAPGGEEEMADDDGVGRGEWSCPSKPPELW
jgi:hypothetical protein